MELQLKKIYNIDIQLELISGLHIGAGDTEMHIGGVDNPVVKHPWTLDPYIPGSSLKGKTRALLEQVSGLMPVTKGAALSLKTLKLAQGNEAYSPEQLKLGGGIIRVFGTGGNEDISEYGPSRASFADANLVPEWKQKALDEGWPLYENKSENSINRIEGKAENPRYTERVPAGAVFQVPVSFKILQAEDEDLLESVLLRGLKLLSLDSLGGSGSRGYGRINLKFAEAEIQERFDRVQPW